MFELIYRMYLIICVFNFQSHAIISKHFGDFIAKPAPRLEELKGSAPLPASYNILSTPHL